MKNNNASNKPLLLTSKEREIIDLYFACCFSTFGTANLKVLNRDVGQSKSHLFSCQVAGDFLTERSILLFIRTALYICTKALNDFNATGQISATRDQLQDRAKQTIAANVLGKSGALPCVLVLKLYFIDYPLRAMEEEDFEALAHDQAKTIRFFKHHERVAQKRISIYTTQLVGIFNLSWIKFNFDVGKLEKKRRNKTIFNDRTMFAVLCATFNTFFFTVGCVSNQLDYTLPALPMINTQRDANEISHRRCSRDVC